MKGGDQLNSISKKKKIIGSILISFVIVLILIGVALYSVSSNKKKDTQSFHAITLKENDPLLFKGMAIPKKETKTYLDPTLGNLNELYVTEGQSIDIGTPLISYQDDKIQEQINEQARGIERVKTSIANTQERNGEAQKKKETAISNITTTKAMINQLEQSSEPEDLAKVQQYTQELAKYEGIAEGQETQIETLETALQDAQADLTERQAAVDQLQQKVTSNVTAEIAGQVHINEEGKVSSTVPLVTIVSPTILIQGQVSEYDYTKLAVGQAVNLNIPSTGDKISGKIEEVDSLPQRTGATDSVGTTSSNQVLYNFKVIPEREIQYGYSVQIELPQNEINVPAKAVKNDKDELYVFVFQKGRVKKQAIKAIKKENFYVVQEGIVKGEKIIENPSKELKDNQEVAVDE